MKEKSHEKACRDQRRLRHSRGFRAGRGQIDPPPPPVKIGLRDLSSNMAALGTLYSLIWPGWARPTDLYTNWMGVHAPMAEVYGHHLRTIKNDNWTNDRAAFCPGGHFIKRFVSVFHWQICSQPIRCKDFSSL